MACTSLLAATGDRDGNRKGYEASVQQAEIEQAMQQRENSAIHKESDRTDNDEATALLEYA